MYSPLGGSPPANRGGVMSFGDDSAGIIGARGESSGDQPSTSSSPRARGGVPVYVMLPLDTVSREGELQRVEELAHRLGALQRAGVEGVMMDVWWGIVERDGPGKYDWAAYVKLVGLVESVGLKLHAVLSFHSCGANRDDDYHVPLPRWVLEAVARDPEGLLFADRAGSKSDEYLSLWADHAPMPMFSDSDATSPVPPRTPLNCYRDLMSSFRAVFAPKLGTTITEVLVGCGPCGELRYPAYAMSRGWNFPGIGEFQCYDRHALDSLAAAAAAVGRPEWGKGGPHDAGSYNSQPDETGFFANGRGSTRRPVQPLFTSRSMTLPVAPDSPIPVGNQSPAGGSIMTARRFSLDVNFGGGGGGGGGGDGGFGAQYARASSDGRARSLDDLVAEGDAPNGRWDSEYGRFFLGWYSGELVAHGERVMGAAAEVFTGSGVRLALKCAGIHWWYRTRSHAAELTTGYYNVEGGSETTGSESAPFGGLNGSGGSQVDVRRASMDWAPASGRDPPASPGGLQKKWSAGSFGSVGSMGGGGGGGSPAGSVAVTTGYDRIMAMCKSVGASITFTCAEMSDREHNPGYLCGPEGLLRQVVAAAARAGVDVAAENALYRCDAVAFKQMVRNCKRGGIENGEGMRSFTFLRLCDSLVEEGNFAEFETFVRDLGGASEQSP